MNNKNDKEHLMLDYQTYNDKTKSYNGEISVKFIRSKILKVYMDDKTEIIWD